MSGTTAIFRQKMYEPVNPESFERKLTEIFAKTSDKDIASHAAQYARAIIKKVENRLNIVTEDTLKSLIKGDIYKQIINIDNIFENKLSSAQKQDIYEIVKFIVSSKLNEYFTFRYIVQTFPAISFLKRELLEKRPGTDIPQWKFITENCMKHDVAKTQCEFAQIVDYKQISDELCGRMLSAIVSHMTEKRFDNIINQKGSGWYNNGFEELAKKHTINSEHLFLIAYSLKLSLKKYDEFLTRNEEYYDCLCFEENMHRFFLRYANDEKINVLENIITNNICDFSHNENGSQDAEKLINNFFRCKNGSINELCGEFCTLLKKIGVVSAKQREEILSKEKKFAAQEFMKETISEIDYNSTLSYYSLLQGSADRIVDNSLNSKQANSIKKSISINYDKLLNTNCENNNDNRKRLASIMSDCIIPLYKDIEKDFHSALKPILKNQFTTAHIGKILNGTAEITRTDIIKTAYLYTLTSFIKNKNKFTDEESMTNAAKSLVKTFEKKANPILKRCCFTPIHTTIPIDGLVEIALSSAINDRCIPEVYQACLLIAYFDIKIAVQQKT